MKNIKTLVLLVVCLCASTLLKAQTATAKKAQAATESEAKQPAPVDVNRIPVPQNNAAETPAMKQGQPRLLTKTGDNPNAGLTPEQAKTAAGTAQKPAGTRPATVKEQ